MTADLAIRVYTRPNCVQCRLTKTWLTTRGIPFDEVPLEGADLDAAISLGHREAPVVAAGTDSWSGFRPDRLDTLTTHTDHQEATA